MRKAISIVLAGLLVMAPLQAQQVRPATADSVRVHLLTGLPQSGPPGMLGTFRQFDGDSVILTRGAAPNSVLPVAEDNSDAAFAGLLVGATVGAGIGYLLGPALFEDTPDRTEQECIRSNSGLLGFAVCAEYKDVEVKGESARMKGLALGAGVLGLAGLFVASRLVNRSQSLALKPSFGLGGAAPTMAVGFTLRWAVR